MKRIAVAQIQQESNTFNPRATEKADFAEYGWAIGEEVMRLHGATDELAGFSHLPEVLG